MSDSEIEKEDFTEIDIEYQKLELLTHKFKTSINMFIEIMNDEELFYDCYGKKFSLLFDDMEKCFLDFKKDRQVIGEKIDKLEKEEEEKQKKIEESKPKRGRKKVTIEE